MKEACHKPKALKVTKKKNISTDGLGTVHGQIHVGKQDIPSIQTRKMKGLKKTIKERKAELSRKRVMNGDNDVILNKKTKVE